MLKSLFSGVSGLQSHQVAMDVESNNIANVNTVGFKYSRANFSDLLAQTKAIATAPQGQAGGKNPVQVGLGSSVNSMTRIFAQGSVQNSDKNTDVAIQGDGFFIISPDGGNTYKYTRAGDFKFDAGGNFVDNNGFIAQGWLRDPVTGKVDSTAPIESINIPPGLTTPANPTQEVVLKANLNSGPLVESFSPAYPVASGSIGATPAVDENGFAIESGDMGVMFNEVGESFALQNGQGIWASFQTASTTSASVGEVGGSHSITFALDDGSLKKVSWTTGDIAQESELTFTGAPTIGDTIDVDVNGVTVSTTLTVADYSEVAAAIQNELVTNQGLVGASATASGNTINIAGASDGTAYTISNITSTNAGYTGSNTTTVTGVESTPEQNAAIEAAAINAATTVTGITATVSGDQVILTNDNASSSASHNIRIAAVSDPSTGFTAGTAVETAYKYTYNSAGPTVNAGADKEFNTIASLREALENQARDANNDGALTIEENNIEISINEQGKFEMTNPGGGADAYNVNLKITGLSGSGVTENERFTRSMEAMNTVLQAGTTGKAFSQSFNVATHSSSIDIFDSLGSKHTLRMEFRKVSLDAATGSEWDMTITVPEPATIDTIAPTYQKKGSIRFNNDGSLATYSPPNLSFTGNNGSSPDQQVNLSFGTGNKFDGITSFDSPSTTSGISQDGYTGGDLVGIRIDQSGTLIGSFSNGRSFGLAQIAMAKFTNNEGLSTEGGNVFIQTANSGDPIIGTAATAGRGFIQSAALEASNVDLSRALTQLIIVQRGFQANGKTITTSDQLLQTLIGLKQ